MSIYYKIIKKQRTTVNSEKHSKKHLTKITDRVIIAITLIPRWVAPHRAEIGMKGGDSMKEGIHPNYKPTTIKCACGNVIETRSTKQDIRVEICSKCHPFFTGKQKLVDSGGRVDKFNKKFGLKK